MVGGTESIQVDVRVVAATNKELTTLVAAGRFREDLFYRLQIVPIVLPPLRERTEDIPLLIESFLDQFAVKHKRRRKTMAAQALRLCQRFDWPGNVRQLRNMVEGLVITCRGAIVAVGDLPEFIRAHETSNATFAVRPGTPLAEVEERLIRQTLHHVTANREQAARVLGISRRALQYKLKRLGLAAGGPPAPPSPTAVADPAAPSAPANRSDSVHPQDPAEPAAAPAAPTP
jgi:transcriptional regulator with PAS, ATPase and Fis domain